jgi:hypothetical protein
VLQDFLEILRTGDNALHKRLREVVDTSVADLPDHVLSMFLDAATIMYGCSETQALCAWTRMHSTTRPAAVRSGWAQLQRRSLVKVNAKTLWVHDVIKALAGEQANTTANGAPIRIWRPSQVSAFTVGVTEAAAAAYVVLNCYICSTTEVCVLQQ